MQNLSAILRKVKRKENRAPRLIGLESFGGKDGGRGGPKGGKRYLKLKN
jgi:hypothetical protein